MNRRNSNGEISSGETLAILFTFTTYGTWLRGDSRGWVSDGIIYPANPELQSADQQRMKHEPFLFDDDQWYDVGEWIGTQLIKRLDLTILAMATRTWHVHFVIKATAHHVGDVSKCAKDAVRYGLEPGRPIWTDGYDKRFCFDEQTVFNRIQYVERHNTELGRPAKPWDFIKDWRD